MRAERGKQLPIPSSHLTESLTFRLQGSRLAKSVLRMGFPSSISISVSQYNHEKSQLRSVVSNVAIHSSPISAVTLPIKHLYLKGKIQSVNVCVKAFHFAAIAHILHVLWIYQHNYNCKLYQEDFMHAFGVKHGVIFLNIPMLDVSVFITHL